MAALSAFVGNTPTFGALLVFAGDWALGHNVIGGFALEAVLPLLTPGFVG